MGHDLVEQMPDLHGRAIEEVTHRLGEPDTELSFTMGNSPGGEFRVPLFNYYPPDRPGSRNVAIKELWWRHSRYTVVIWFHKDEDHWVAFDSCRWKKGIAF
jgi:hypothetical protein